MKSVTEIVLARPSRTQLVLSVLFVIAMLVSYLTRNGDFDVFYAGMARYISGARVHMPEYIEFTYPTFLAMVLSPLTVFGPTAARVLFFLLSVFCMFAGLRLVNHHLLQESVRPNLVFWISLVVVLRYLLSVFDNQQSDYIVFFLVIAGLHLHCQQRQIGAGLWAMAALIKTNPLFMVLHPFFHRNWIALALFLSVVIAGILLPDILRPGPDESAFEDGEFSVIVVPSRAISKEGENAGSVYPLEPASAGTFSHITDYINLVTGTHGKESWWKKADNPLNQSLTIISYKLVGIGTSNIWSHFLFWCGFFSGLLFLLARKNSADPFVLGLLFYCAFVLIGPMSSKPHFIAFYGLFVFLWRDLIEARRFMAMAVLGALCMLFGFTTRGLMGDYAHMIADYGHIGIIGLVIWLWVYWRLFSRNSEADAISVS